MLLILPLPDLSAGPAGPDLTRYLMVCGLLVLCIAALGLAFRALFARKLKSRAARRSLQIVDVLPMGGKQRLVVVRCYDRVFLLGQGEKELRSLAELHEDEIRPPAKASSDATEPATESTPAAPSLRPARDFSEHLGYALTQPAPRPRQATLEEGRGVLG